MHRPALASISAPKSQRSKAPLRAGHITMGSSHSCEGSKAAQPPDFSLTNTGETACVSNSKVQGTNCTDKPRLCKLSLTRSQVQPACGSETLARKAASDIGLSKCANTDNRQGKK
jgi:hypothetical protein